MIATFSHKLPSIDRAIAPNPIIMTPETPVLEAIAHMHQVRCTDAEADVEMTTVRGSCVIVMDAERLLGVLTEGDVVRLCAEGRLHPSVKIADSFITSAISCQKAELTDVLTVLNLFHQHHLQHLIVFDGDQQIAGLVTYESLGHCIHSYSEPCVNEPSTDFNVRSQTTQSYQAIEQELFQSETINRILLEALPDLLIRVDREGHYRYLKSKGSNLAVLDPEEAKHLSIHEILPPDIAEHTLCAIHQTLDTGEIQHYEQYLEVNGKPRWEEVRITAFSDQEALVIVRDISDRKQSDQERCRAELALRHSEAEKRAILGAIPDLLFRVSGDGIYLGYVAPNRQYDILPGTIDPTGKHFSEVLPPHLAQLQLQTLQQVLTTEEVQVYEQQIVVGNRLQYEEVRVVKSGENEALFMIRDISDRKQAEVALRNSETRFRAVFEQAGVGLVWIDFSGHFLQVNQCYCDIVGYSAEELLGKRFHDITHPDDIQPDLQLTEELFSGQRESFSLEKRYLRKDGTVCWVHLTATVIRDPDGQVLHELAVVTDISDRKQAEVALLTSEARFQTILESSPLPIFIKNLEGRYIVSNQAYARLIQHTQDEILDATDFDLLPTDIAIACQQSDHQAIQNGMAVQFEETFQTQDGMYELLITKFPLYDSEKQPYAIGGIFVDISDRKQAEQRLRESEVINCAIIQSIPDLLIRVNRQGEYLNILSGGELKHTLLPDENISKPTVYDVLPKRLADRRTEAMSQAWATGKVQSYEHLIELDGQLRWEEVRISPIGEAEALIVVRDISDRKQVEAALRDSEERFRSTFEQAAVGICHVSMKGQFLRVNQRICEILGYSKTELLMLDFQSITHPEDLRQGLVQQQQLFGGEIDTFALEKRYMRKDGSFIWATLTVSLLRSPTGQPQSLISVIEDITTRKQAEEALRQSEATNRAIVQAIPDLLIRANKQGQHLKILGQGSIQHVFLPCLDSDSEETRRMFPPHLAQQRLQALNQAIVTGTLQVYEQTLELDGEFRWEEVRVAPLDENDALVMIRDITARKQAEFAFQNLVEGAAAIAGENFFAEMVRYIADVFDVRCVMVATLCGDRMASSAFWLDGQLQPNISYNLEDSPCYYVIQEGAYICSQGVLEQFPEHSILAQLEAETYVGVALTNAQGEALGCLYMLDTHPIAQLSFAASMLRVFAARVSAELERQQAIDALKNLNQDLEARVGQRTIELRQSEARFRQIFEQSPVGIAISDLDGKITRVNSSLRSILGYSEEELLQHSLQNFLPQDRQAQGEQRLEQLLEQTLAILSTEDQFLSKQGETVWVQMTSALIFNSFGHPDSIIHLMNDISARKQSEALLQHILKELSDFKYALDQAAIVAITDAQGMLTYVNDRFCNVTKYNRSELIGRTYHLLNSNYHSNLFFANLWNTISSGKIWQGELQNRAKDGSTYWVDITIVPFLADQGQPWQYLTIGTEITDRKQAEHAMARYAREVEDLYNHAPCGYHSLDAEGRIVNINDTELNWLGYSREDMLGELFVDFLTSESQRLFLKNYGLFKDQGWVNDLECDLVCKDGLLIPVLFSSTAVRDGQGNFLYSRSTLFDMRDRKASEVVLKQQLAAIEAAIDGIAILDDHYTHTYVNQSHLDLFGYENREELMGQPWNCLYSSDEIRRFEQVVFPELTQNRYWQGEAIAQRKDGSTFIEGLSLTLTDHGTVICVCRDITERKQAEEQLILSNAELARATRLKDEFLANMSHELRTPLNAILGTTEGLQEEVFGQLDESQKRAIAIIERSGRHLLDLINDILDLSKIESGKLELQVAPVSIDYLCKSSLTFVRQQATQKGLHLCSTIPQGLPEISVDERRIRQVLINLLSNAVKFTPEGGSVELVVNTEIQDTGCFLLISVHDTGIGIAEENLEKIFQSFVQIDSSLSRQYAGTGLGLVLVRQLTELHGGTVTVTSQTGAGSCFTLRLPYTHASPTTLNSLSGMSSALENLASTRILLIEDALVASEQTTRYLEELGADLVMHPRGMDALEEVLRVQPGLIILDVQLPDVSGWDVLAQIKHHPQTQNIPVLIISVVDERSRGLSLGAFEYLVKPITRGQLRKAIAKMNLGNAPALPTEKAELPVSSGTVPESSLILLAEDNPANVATLSAYLTSRGFRLIFAKNGAEAIEMTLLHHPNLILMDIQMPDMDGLEAIRQIRANSSIAEIPIIALTALAMSSDREKCIQAGATDYLTKPVRLKWLVELMQSLLKR
jgi:PAS domain S-box-containing protein